MTDTNTEVYAGTILMVEDAEEVRQMVKMLLGAYGIQTLEAGTGPEALEIWTKSSPTIDLLFVDLVLPGGISGPKLATQLMAENSKLHVIYTTGYHPASVSEDLTLLEGINFLQKPYDSRMLAQMVRKRLGVE